MQKKRHHYIPRFFISNFCFNSTHIWLYNHDLKNILEKPVHKKNLFLKTNLYTFVDKNGNIQNNVLEDIYDKDLERKGSASMRSILNKFNKIEPEKELFVEDYFNCLEFCLYTKTRNLFKIKEFHCNKLRILNAPFLVDYYMKHNTTDLNVKVSIEKAHLLFEYLELTHKILNQCLDLKITLIGNKSKNKFFLLTDQPVVLSYSGNKKFEAEDLKVYFPISSHFMICFERIKRKDYVEYQEFSGSEIDSLNLILASNFYYRIACESREYLENFLTTNKNKLVPLKEQEPENFEREFLNMKNQIITKFKSGKPRSVNIEISNNEVIIEPVY